MRSLWTIVCVLVVATFAVPVAAGPYVMGGFDMVGPGSFHFGDAIGQPRDGRNDVTLRFSMAMLGIGYQTGPWRFGLHTRLGQGGLDLTRAETVYAEVEEEELLGSSGHVGVGIHTTYAVYGDPTAGLHFPLGIAFGTQSLFAASPAVSARLDQLYGELRAGAALTFARRHTVHFAAIAQFNWVTSGRLKVHVDGQPERTYTGSPDEPFYFSPGGGAAYQFSF